MWFHLKQLLGDIIEILFIGTNTYTNSCLSVTIGSRRIFLEFVFILLPNIPFAWAVMEEAFEQKCNLYE
jgi:hypothetical protein